jgi:DNA-directed RNA polymerase specialized sigma subunit
MAGKTIDIIKQKRKVPEALKQRHKEYLAMRKKIREALSEREATIPEIAVKTGLPADQVVFIMMTMRKYNEIVAGEMNEDREYYYYKLKADE